MTRRLVWFALAAALGAATWPVVGAGLADAPPAVLQGGGVAPAPVRLGEARVWYLGHCGFAVRTARHVLIFDYQERRDGPVPRVRPETIGLEHGWVDPAELSRDRVRVFVSHGHGDHHDPVIDTWRRTVPDIKYFFGWESGDDPLHHDLVGPRAAYAADGLEIVTINSHHSDVPEVAFLVMVDGLAIYHNGDYQMDYQADFPYLQTKARAVDLMFVPGVFREDLKYTIQNLDLFARFRPEAVFPMHAQAGAPMYREFAEALSRRLPDLRVVVPERLGQRFEYRGRTPGPPPSRP